MKNRKRAVSLLLVALLLFSALCACGDDPGMSTPSENPGTTPEAPEFEDDDPNTLTLLKDGEAGFVVTYGEGLLKDTYDACGVLSNAFEKRWNVRLFSAKVWSDNLKDTRCIVYGDNGEESVRELSDSLRLNDYRIFVDDRHVHLVAKSAEAFSAATNTLVAKLVKIAGESSSTQDLSLEKDYTYSYEARYKIMNATIENVALRDFKLLRPDTLNISDETVDLLKKNLESAYGYPIEKATEEKAGEHYVRFSVEPENLGAMDYGFRVENGDLLLTANGYYSAKCLADDAVNLLRKKTSATEFDYRNGDSFTATILENPDGLAKAQGTELRVMQANVTATFDGWDSGSAAEGYPLPVRTEIFEAFLDVYEPDVVGLQEICDQWYAYLTAFCAKSTKWGLLNGGKTRPYYLNCILYRKDKLDVIAESSENFSVGDSQAWGGRWMVWGVFKDKTTANQFVLLDTHWTGFFKNADQNDVQSKATRAKVKDLHDKYGVSVIVTGDFNTRDYAEDPGKNFYTPTVKDTQLGYANMIEDGGVVDAKFSAEVRCNNIGSCHGWGNKDASFWSYDHVFVTNDTRVLQFKTVCENRQHWLTDHAFLIADVILSKK